MEIDGTHNQKGRHCHREKDTGVGTLRGHGKEADPASPRNERWKKSINVMETWGQLRYMEQDRERWNSSG